MFQSSTIRTAGQVEIEERIEFFTKTQFTVGDTVALKPAKPFNAPVYGNAQIVAYLGEGQQPGHRKYRAKRIN